MAIAIWVIFSGIRKVRSFLDFDDMVRAPAAQDIWLLTPGRDQETKYARESLLEGYTEFRAFDRSTLRLIEPLRALRFVHYTAWVARRWEDPAFPAAFPEFGSHHYWADETQDLEEQLRLIRESAVDFTGLNAYRFPVPLGLTRSSARIISFSPAAFRRRPANPALTSDYFVNL